MPLSYNVPDHFSHLVPLLPHPTPQGVVVPVRVELLPASADEDEMMEALGVQTHVQTEKGVKVRWPPKRTTIGEMRRRVRAMMEYVARAQLDAGERERRVELLRKAQEEAGREAEEAIPVDGFHAPTAGEATMEEPKTTEELMAIDDLDDLNAKRAGNRLVPKPKQLNPGEVAAAALDPEEATDSPVKARSPSPPLTKEKVARPKISTASLIEDPRVTPSTLLEATNTASGSRPSSTSHTPTGSGPGTGTGTGTGTSSSKLVSDSNSPSFAQQQQQALASITTTQLLDELTRELIQFQERFGAGREGKVYRSDRAEARERRTRGPAAAVSGGGGGADEGF